MKNRVFAKVSRFTVFLASLITLFWLDWSTIKAISVTVTNDTLLWSLIYPATVGTVALLVSRKNRCLILGLSIIGTALMAGIDRIYFHFFSSLPSISTLQAMQQIWDVHYSIYMLVKPDIYLPLLFGLVVLFSSRLLGFTRGSEKGERVMMVTISEGKMVLRQSHLAWPLLVSLIIAGSFAPPWTASQANTNLNDKTDWVQEFSPIAYASEHGLAIYHVNDIYQTLMSVFITPELTPERRQAVTQFIQHKKALNETKSPLFGIAKDRNIVLLQMESWAQYLVDMEIDGNEITPKLNQLKQEGLFFNNIYDVTLHGRSSDAEFAVLTGLLPDTRKPAQMSQLDSVFPSLPAILKQQDYWSNAIHGHEKDFWNIDAAHRKYQIDESFYQDAFEGKQQIGLGINDRDVFTFAADKIKDLGSSRFMSLIISLTSHHPFRDIPVEYATLYDTLRMEDGYGLIPDYLRSVRYSDDALAEFFRQLETTQAFNNTIFVIYGDHDPGHTGSRRLLKNIDMQALANDRVPLLIYVPGQEKTIKQYQSVYSDVTGGLQDVMPTLLHLLGMEIPQGVIGTHLFVNNSQRDPVPLPASPATVAKNAEVLDANRNQSDIDYREAFEQQLMVRDILDFKLLQAQSAGL